MFIQINNHYINTEHINYFSISYHPKSQIVESLKIYFIGSGNPLTIPICLLEELSEYIEKLTKEKVYTQNFT